MKTITVANRKGGAGKTTTTVTVACAFAELGLRTLVIDCDSQGHVAAGMGLPDDDPGRTLTAALEDANTDISDLVYTVDYQEGVHVLPGGGGLVATELLMQDAEGSEMLLRSLLEEVEDRYDVVVIDTPPALGNLTQAALIAADWILIVSEPDQLGMNGVLQLLHALDELKSRGFTPEIAGLLLTRVNDRLNLTAEVRDAVQDDHGFPLLPVAIPETVRTREAVVQGVPVLYRPVDRFGRQAAEAYRQAAAYLVERCGLQAAAPRA